MSELNVTKIENEADSSAVEINRKASDGTIIDLQKDGSTIGRIGTNGGEGYFSSSATGIKGSGSSAILPTNNTGASADGNRDLGSTSVRWRNAYLSGGVFLGGTGAANKLEDYEEGTWTASFYTSTGGGGTLLGTKTATYTKIGRLVHVSYYADNVGSGIRSIAGLPFSMTGYASGITSDGVNFYTSSGMTVNYRTADNSFSRTEFTYQTTA
jgi:hypothetical protein